MTDGKTGAKTWREVWGCELDEIAASRNARGVTRDADAAQNSVEDRASDLNLIGLAFSGGGIRSATFNLGVLQALAAHGLLPACDYLSTVSGGGYVGSWFA